MSFVCSPCKQRQQCTYSGVILGSASPPHPPSVQPIGPATLMVTAGFLFPRCVGSVLPKSGLGVVAGTASLDCSIISMSSGNPPSLQPLLIDCLPSILLFFLPQSFRAPQCCLVQVSPRDFPAAVVRPLTVFSPGALHSLLVSCVLTFPVVSLAWWLIVLDLSVCCSQNVWVCSIPRPGSHFLRFSKLWREVSIRWRRSVLLQQSWSSF